MPLMVIFYFSAHLLSIPSRGAWIEMPYILSVPISAAVDPLTGSVDRNRNKNLTLKLDHTSIPSRGAWIEM